MSKINDATQLRPMRDAAVEVLGFICDRLIAAIGYISICSPTPLRSTSIAILRHPPQTVSVPFRVLRSSNRGNSIVDRLEHYRTVIKTLLNQYADSMNQNSQSTIEVETVFDMEHDRYLLLDVGWQDKKRIHHCIFHFDIKNGKIWLQENNTDIEVDAALEAMGISKQEIVIGFHHPSIRIYPIAPPRKLATLA